MTMVRRQIWWLGFFAVLLVTTGGTFFLLPQSTSLVQVVLPLLLVYGWVRFIVLIWKPLYKDEVSPAWSVAVLFAAFAIFFMVMAVYKIAGDRF